MTELPDRLLRDVLRETSSATSPAACVDANALAAWADGTMGGAARAAFEAHAADCTRCQALMAAMARTEPPPIERAWWRRSRVAWIVPLAAAAAAAVIVVNVVVTERGAPVPVSQVARTEATARDQVLPSTGAPAPGSPVVTVPARRATPRQPEPAANALRTQDAASPTSTIDARAKRVVVPPLASPVPAPAVPRAAATAPPATFSAQENRVDTTADRVAASGMLKAEARGPIVIASPERASLWRIVG